MMKSLICTLSFLLVTPPAFAQKTDHAHHRRAESIPHRADSTDTPTGLSPDEVAGLREGLGMGLARPAELHSYPGPKHVLELADDLDLTDAQRAEAEHLMRSVQTEARALGAQIVAQEQALDDVFSEGRATASLVEAVTGEIGALNAQLRAVHLRAHVAMREALTPEQIAEYDRLRGYTD